LRRLENNVPYNITNHTIFTAEIEKAWFNKFKSETNPKKKDIIRKHIAQHNMKFVMSVAKTYRLKFNKIPMADLVAYGTLGLFTAIERFDPSQDKKFITLAVWWVKQSIVSNVQTNETAVRIPLHKHEEIRKKKKQYDEDNSVYDEEVSNAINTMNGGVSLDKKISINNNSGPSNGDTLGDLMGDTNAVNQDDTIDLLFLKKGIEESINALNNEDKLIINSFYGLDTHPKTMVEIGVMVNKTRECVRGKKDKIEQKLKRNSMMNKVFTDYCV